MAKKATAAVEEDDVDTGTDEGETETEVTEDDLESVEDLKPEAETVRETLNRTLKEKVAEETAAQGAPLAAPADWDDEGKKLFGSVQDRKLQEFMLKRHGTSAEAIKKLTDEHTAYRTAWDPIAKILEPYAETLKKANTTPAAVVQRYINAELFLNNEPIQAIHWFMKRYGVTPEKLAAEPYREGKPAPGKGADGKPRLELDANDPRDAVLLGLQKESDERKQRDQQERDRQTEENRTQIVTAMKTMIEEKDKAGNLAYPHASDEAIRKLMGTYITNGIVDIQKSGGLLPAFKAAYDMAVNAHAPTRESVFKARLEAEAAKKVSEDKRKVDKAKRLGSGLSGGGSSGTAQTQKKGESVGNTLRKTAAAIGYGNSQ